MWLPNKRLMISADHGGIEQKAHLVTLLQERGITVVDAGCHEGESVDYPEYGAKVARAVLAGEVDAGIVICGTGIGISIAANRFKGIRCTLCHNTAYAQLAREHNNSNILAISGRFITPEEAAAITNTWLDTPFEGGRHERRLAQLDTL